LEPRFQGEGVVSGENFLASTKLNTFSYLTVQTTVLRAVVLTQYRRVTDEQTDEIAEASTALAMRRAVKTVMALVTGKYCTQTFVSEFIRGSETVRLSVNHVRA